MAVADPPRIANRGNTDTPFDARRLPTSPLRVYAADQQPIRLLAGLQGISPAEVVHRAIAAYFRTQQDALARVAKSAQRAFETGDYALLTDALEESTRTRSRRRRERLERISNPIDA